MSCIQWSSRSVQESADNIAPTEDTRRSRHDAEYFRQHRRALDVPERNGFSAPKFLRRATEPHRLEQLPWPKNLFGEPASIAELLAEAAQLSKQAGENLDDARTRAVLYYDLEP
jgi:hypothetical protein